MEKYGFIVLPEEQPKNWSLNLFEGEQFPKLGDLSSCRTIFVEVETARNFSGKLTCSFYYHTHMAKSNVTTEEILRKRFPKSFAKNDIYKEYDKLRRMYNEKF